MSYPMLNSDLEALKNTHEFQGKPFSITKIQRFMGIGYNRACHLVEAAIECGVLVQCQEHDGWIRLAK